MASVPGGQYTLFANGNNMNVVATPDGAVCRRRWPDYSTWSC